METIKLNIHNIGHNGEGIGLNQGFTVFIDGALPGETVEAQITEHHKRYKRARLQQIFKPSPDRIDPPCSFFGKCGGCQLMHLAYDQQLQVKRQRVVDALQRIGKITDVEVLPCLPSPTELHYRNKIQLPVREEKIGLYARSSHEIIDVDSCKIHCDLGEKVFGKIKSIVSKSKFIRHLLIKTAVHTHEVLVILVTGGEESEEFVAIAQEIMEQSPLIKGVIQNINLSQGNVILGDRYHVLQGAGFIQEHLCGLTFKVSPASFFQVNPRQAEQLYAKALEMASLTGQETVLDAYCGVGTLSLIFARQTKQVVGVECVPQAIEDAKENANANHIKNATFICANAETYIQKLSEIDMVLLNPPRKGCEPSFLEGIKRLQPKKVVYISCDPATLARDLHQLEQSGYQVQTVQPVDMFPQTAHVECVVNLTRV